jgi:hypothetical protein
MNNNANNNGMALILVMLAVTLIAGGLLSIAISTNSSRQLSALSVTQIQADEVAKAGMELGIYQVWGAYLAENEGAGNLDSYVSFIKGYVPNNEDLNHNGVQDETELDLNGDGLFEINGPVFLVTEAEPVILEEEVAAITRLTVTRTDDLTGSTITLLATGQAGGKEQTLEQTVRVAGELFEGFDYALLAQNVNCILCHAKFVPLDLDRNEDAELYGTFDRIKVASLESLMYRTGGAHSYLAGTLYTRGEVMNDKGTKLSASGLAQSTFKGYDFDSETGEVDQNHSTGNMSVAALLNADLDEDNLPVPYANLYQNYPTEEEEMTDGILPTTFPAPFPDKNSDRNVNSDEFDAVAEGAEGSITGGVVFGVPNGAFFDEPALPVVSNEAQAALAGSGHYDGNLVLVGTPENPIVIDGVITIDGDLIIKGSVEGKGQLMVRRNSYVVGDVTYADADGEFGVSDNGVTNALALVSGGSTLMGDYLTIRGKNDTSLDNKKYPNKAYSIQVREEHVQKIVKGELLQYGYFDPGSMDPGAELPTMINDDGIEVPRQGQQFSFTTSELMLFNKREIDKAALDPGYRPRFYGLRESQPNDLYVYDSADEHSVRYSEDGVKLLTDYMIDAGLPLEILDNAAFHYMSPEMNWLGEDTLRRIWFNDELSRTGRDMPFRFDGLLYSTNAIFAITRSYSRHGSHTEGAMTIRGAIICPDLGVLVPGNGGINDKALVLKYDRRVSDFMQLEDVSQVAFSRTFFRWINPEPAL